MADVACVVLAGALSPELIWQREYPGVGAFYAVDAVAWVVSVKVAKMEFERRLPAHGVSRGYWALACAVSLGRLASPR